MAGTVTTATRGPAAGADAAPLRAGGAAPDWPVPPTHPELAQGDVHVWRASLDHIAGDADRMRVLHALLTSDERQRATAFHRPRDRDRFVAARATLRLLLGRYVHEAPGALRFAYGRHGKPAVRRTAAQASANFSVSHAGSMIVYAVAQGVAVGVDVEDVRRDVPHAPLAARFFSARERDSVLAAPSDARATAFFRCWTRKEAYLKGTGDGTCAPLHRCDASRAPEQPVHTLDRSDRWTPTRWHVYDVDVGHQYAASVAIGGSSWRVACFETGE